MWNEPSAGVAVAALDPSSSGRQPQPAVVASVESGSIGEELGFEPGDQLLSINGIRPRDLIDYRYLCVCLLYTSPSPRDTDKSRMPSSA